MIYKKFNTFLLISKLFYFKYLKKMEEEEIFAIKLGKNISIGCEINGQVAIIKDRDNNSSFDYLIKIDNTEINVNEVTKYIIEEKFEQIREEIKILYIDDIYKIQVLKSGKIYLFEEILVKLFEKIKLIIRTSLNKQLTKAIIIFNNLPHEIRLLFHIAALISGIQINNFIDLNKSITFYLYNNNKPINDNSVAMIKIDEKIEISIFEKNNKVNGNIKKIFNTILNKDDFLINLPLKEDINEIDDKNEKIEYIKNIINQLTQKAYGTKETLNKIYILNNKESERLSQIAIFGALYSNKFPISKEFTLIINFIDYTKDYPLSELIIMEKKYEINQNRLEIIIDDNDIPFSNCFYKNIKITFSDNSSKENIDNILTVYYNQKNFYSCTKDIKFANSSEFIFFKNIPKITVNNEYNISVEEKFEQNQVFKRINILNVNRDNIRFNDNPLIYYDAFNPLNKEGYQISEDQLSPNILFLIGKNLQILSFFNKDLFYKSSIIQDKYKKSLLKLLENMNIIDKNDSLSNLIENKKQLLQMIMNCSVSFNISMFQNYEKGNVQNFNQYDADLLIKYGKFQIFKKIFYHKFQLELNELNYNIYKKIFELLNTFYEQCKKIEKDSLILAKLYNATCHMVLDYINFKKNGDEISEGLTFDLIQFDKDSIYKDGNDNNIDLILNLTKKSFLYPYLLQFNSSFNFSQILIYNNDYVATCETSMITLNQIKLNLIQSLPKYGIRISFDTDYLANTILNTDITIYNEKKIFGHFLNEKELDKNNDTNYIKRVKMSFLQKHERFSHYRKYLNKSEKDYVNSPRGIINYEEDKVCILTSKNDIEKRELGASLDFILTNGNRDLIDNIFNLKENKNLKEFYEINLFLESNNRNLIDKLKEIENSIGNENDSMENIKNPKIEVENKDSEFEKRKIEMIRANPIRKYTFERNTIQLYRIIDGKLVPFENVNNK